MITTITTITTPATAPATAPPASAVVFARKRLIARTR